MNCTKYIIGFMSNLETQWSLNEHKDASQRVPTHSSVRREKADPERVMPRCKHCQTTYSDKKKKAGRFKNDTLVICKKTFQPITQLDRVPRNSRHLKYLRVYLNENNSGRKNLRRLKDDSPDLTIGSSYSLMSMAD